MSYAQKERIRLNQVIDDATAIIDEADEQISRIDQVNELIEQNPEIEDQIFCDKLVRVLAEINKRNHGGLCSLEVYGDLSGGVNSYSERLHDFNHGRDEFLKVLNSYDPERW